MKKILSITLACILFISCKKGFEPIEYGKDACAHCKMTIVDDRYATELVTDKGKAYKFDDVTCMRGYIEEQKIQSMKTLYFVEDYAKKSATPLEANKAIYLQHEFFESPMNGNYAAFATVSDAKPFMDSLKIPILSWEDIK